MLYVQYFSCIDCLRKMFHMKRELRGSSYASDNDMVTALDEFHAQSHTHAHNTDMIVNCIVAQQ